MLSVSSWKIDSSDVNMVVSFFYDLNTFSLTSLFQFSDYIVWRCKRCLRGRHLSIFHTSNKLSLSCNSSPAFSFSVLIVVPLLVPVILLHLGLLVENTPNTRNTSNLQSLQKKLWNRGSSARFWTAFPIITHPLREWISCEVCGVTQTLIKRFN